jgi:hypothetical protein
MPNRYVAAFRPVLASTYCGSSLMKSSKAAMSSREVNLSRALGCTTRLIAAPRGFGFSGTSHSRPSVNPSPCVDALRGFAYRSRSMGLSMDKSEAWSIGRLAYFLWSAGIANG